MIWDQRRGSLAMFYRNRLVVEVLGLAWDCDLVRGTLVPGLNDQQALSDEQLRGCVVALQDLHGERHVVGTEVSGGVLKFDDSEALGPIRRLDVLDSVDGMTLVSLDGLCPVTDREFEESFKAKRSRLNVPRLDFFVGKQTFENFTGTIGYRVSAAVVCGYKAVELRDGRYLEEAEMMLLQALIVLPSGNLEKTPRNNREHLQVSVLTALWHVYLAKGEARKFLRTLTSLRDLIAQKNFQSYFILGFNMGKTLRTLTLLYKLAGMESESAENAKLARQLFQLSAQGATGVLAHFSELGTFHRDVLECMRLVRKTGGVSGTTVDRTLKESLRISAEDHPDSFRALKSTLVEAASLLSPFSASEDADR